MSAINVHKVICYVPSEVRRSIIQEASSQNISISKLYRNHIDDYLAFGLNEDLRSIVFSLSASSQEETMNFYLSGYSYKKLREASTSSLRSLRAEAAYFSAFIYKQIKSKTLVHEPTLFD